MLKVKFQLRQLVASSFLRQCRFTLLLGTDSLQSSKAMFKRLDSRIAETFAQGRFNRYEPTRLCDPVTASKSHGNVPNIILQFQTNEAPHLAAVQIDA